MKCHEIFDINCLNSYLVTIKINRSKMKNVGKVMGILLVLLGLGLSAQVPQKIAYQAVLRNSDGTVMANQQVELQVVLHKTTPTGDVVYSETHTGTTTNQGIVSFVIGTGTVNSGTFSSIVWADPIFIELKVKKSGQTSFTAMGTSQIISVPYAFLAEKSLSANNGISGTGNPGNTVYSNGLEWSPTARVSVMDSTVIVSPGAGHDPNKPIFAVTNSQGQVVMAVYEKGVRFNVEGSSSKGAKGGFAVGGLTNGKAPVPTYFQLEPTYAQFLFEQPGFKGAKGGFAVGGLTNAKTDTLNYMVINPDSTRFYIDNSSAKGAKGGFAVGGLTNAKAVGYNYLTVKPEQTTVMFDTVSAKGAKGGFAVGGLTNAKQNMKKYFEVTPDSTYVVNTMVSYSDMVTTGNVFTNVGITDVPVIDKDGNTYRTVKIGTQIWMAENLRTTKYSDGTEINSDFYYAFSNLDSAKVFGYYYYLDSAAIANDSVCPEGWHLPTQVEWETLFAFVEGADWILATDVLFKKIVEPRKSLLSGIYNWNNYNSVNYATNETGFSIRGAGSNYWDNFNGWGMPIVGNGAKLLVKTSSANIKIVSFNPLNGDILIQEADQGEAYSIRCVKN